MNGLIIRGSWWWRFLPMAYSGMALFPFIFFRNKQSPNHLLWHERIHLHQQLETGIIPFYFWYLGEYLILRLSGKNHLQAYMGICFEREAFQNDRDPEYLRHRRFWAFLDYYKR